MQCGKIIMLNRKSNKRVFFLFQCPGPKFRSYNANMQKICQTSNPPSTANPAERPRTTSLRTSNPGIVGAPAFFVFVDVDVDVDVEGLDDPVTPLRFGM